MTRRKVYSIDESSEDDHEDMKLLKHKKSPASHRRMIDQLQRSSETVFDVSNLRNPYEDDETLEDDTHFVVSAVNESHESLCKLVSE